MRKTGKILGALLMALALTLTLAPVGVLADGLDPEGDINNVAPTISAYSMKNGDGTAFGSTADCEVEYRVDFTVTDNNTLEDLTNVRVQIGWEDWGSGDPGDANKRSLYVFTWTESTNAWTGSPAGYLDPTHTSSAPTNKTENSFAFSLYFKLAGVALPANSASWSVYIIATDDSSATGTGGEGGFFLNKYTNLSLGTSALDFGSANPGAAFSDSPTTTATITCNTALDLPFTGDNLMGISYHKTMASTNFEITGGDLTDAPVTLVAQMVKDDYVQTEDTLDVQISGYTDAEAIDLTFGAAQPQVVSGLIPTLVPGQ